VLAMRVLIMVFLSEEPVRLVEKRIKHGLQWISIGNSRIPEVNR
jgi:hypothetical protein